MCHESDQVYTVDASVLRAQVRSVTAGFEALIRHLLAGVEQRQNIWSLFQNFSAMRSDALLRP